MRYLCWDHRKKHLTGRFFIINGQNMFKGLFLLVKHLVFSAANTSIYSELAFNHCLTTSIFASKNLEKVDMVKVFLALVTKCVTFFDLHFVLSQKLDKSWNRARAIQHLLKEHLMFCHLPIHQPTSNIKWWFAVNLFRHLLPRMRYQWR